MTEIFIYFYVITGVLLATAGPGWAEISRQIEQSLGPMRSSKDFKSLFKNKVLLFIILSVTAYSLLWPFFLFDSLKGKIGHLIPRDEKEDSGDGLRFYLMGGHGTLRCKDCHFSEELSSFIHLTNSSISGFQCKVCGKLTARGRNEPFVPRDSTKDHLGLAELPPDERISRINYLVTMVDVCESNLSKASIMSGQRAALKRDIAGYKDKLSDISESELQHIKKIKEDCEKDYLAALFCECGGHLDRDSVVFWPDCKSTNLSYSTEYFT